jgi:EthD domain
MIKQIVFLKKRDDLTMEQFMEYYENQHSQLSKRIGAKPPLPNAQRYVRRYLTLEKNPLTGEMIHPGYDCIMEIWWNTREDFEAAMKGLGNAEHLQARLADERKLFATNSNPVCTVEEHDSPVGPNNQIPRCVPTFAD